MNIEKEKGHPNWRVYFDGTINVHGSEIRAILISLAGAHFPMAFKLRFLCTNNMAEYEVCIVSLEAVLDMNVKDCNFMKTPCLSVTSLREKVR